MSHIISRKWFFAVRTNQSGTQKIEWDAAIRQHWYNANEKENITITLRFAFTQRNNCGPDQGSLQAQNKKATATITATAAESEYMCSHMIMIMRKRLFLIIVYGFMAHDGFPFYLPLRSILFTSFIRSQLHSYRHDYYFCFSPFRFEFKVDVSLFLSEIVTTIIVTCTPYIDASTHIHAVKESRIKQPRKKKKQTNKRKERRTGEC